MQYRDNILNVHLRMNVKELKRLKLLFKTLQLIGISFEKEPKNDLRLKMMWSHA